MDMDPRDFFCIGHAIHEGLNNNQYQTYENGLIRVSLGRYYYSTFLYLRNQIISGAPNTSYQTNLKYYFKYNGHQNLIIYLEKLLKNMRYSNPEEVSSSLDKLLILRKTADYELDKEVTLRTLKKAKEHRTFVLSEVKSALISFGNQNTTMKDAMDTLDMRGRLPPAR
ncbi:hypothetical protein [Methanococcus sp. CF]